MTPTWTATSPPLRQDFGQCSGGGSPRYQAVKAGQVLVRIDPRDYQARVDQAKAAVLEAESKLHTARVTIPMVSETTQSGNTAASAQLADAEAEVVRARAAWGQSNSSDLAVAQANVQSKQASSDRAQADLARMQPLVDKAEISRLQFDSYTAAARGRGERTASRPAEAGLRAPGRRTSAKLLWTLRRPASTRRRLRWKPPSPTGNR